MANNFIEIFKELSTQAVQAVDAAGTQFFYAGKHMQTPDQHTNMSISKMNVSFPAVHCHLHDQVHVIYYIAMFSNMYMVVPWASPVI